MADGTHMHTCGKICARVRHRGAQINVIAVGAAFSFRILPLSSQVPLEICQEKVAHSPRQYGRTGHECNQAQNINMCTWLYVVYGNTAVAAVFVTNGS